MVLLIHLEIGFYPELLRTGDEPQQYHLPTLIRLRRRGGRDFDTPQFPLTILEVVVSLWDAHCWDQRDRIYGLLGLGNDTIAHQIESD
jgi:hypothetical protein